MGALPKNKITRVEQGKRRRGNAPKLKRDINVTPVPLAKQGLVNQVFAALGISIKKTAAESKKA